MKKTTKVVLTSALTCAFCTSLIAGSTLALFSSRSNVNVAITSGKVDVAASVDTASLTGYSTEWDESVFDYVQKPTSELTVEGEPLPANTFLAGGTYNYEAGELKLDGLAPGDAVEFKLNIENNSTLAIQYRVQLTVPTQQESGDPQDEIVKELQVSFNDEDPVTIGDESTFAQPWSAVIDKGVAIEDTPKVKVELPYTVENEYEDQSCLLHIGVYAVQLGTHVADAEGTYNAYTANDLIALGKMSKTFEGETIELGADIDLGPTSDGGISTLSYAVADENAIAPIADKPAGVGVFIFRQGNATYPVFKGTFNGNGYKISNFTGFDGGGSGDLYNTKSGEYGGYGLFCRTSDATIENVVLENAKQVLDTDYQTNGSKGHGYAGALAGYAIDTTFRNIVVLNSSVISETDYNAKCRMYGGRGYKNARTREEVAAGTDPSLPLVAYDYVGALAGKIQGNTTIESVQITLNETPEELTGMKMFGNAPESVVDNTAYKVNYIGTSTITCISNGVTETMTFTSDNNGENGSATAPAPAVSLTTGDALSSVAQSVKDGRKYEGITVTLTDDIELTEDSDLTIGEGTFQGTIDGNGKTVSGLDLENAGLLSGANVQNVNLEFTAESSTVTVADPDSELAEIAKNYKNTTVTVAKDSASYTVTYGEAGLTAAAFNGNEFEAEQTLATGIAYSFDGVKFNTSLSGAQETKATIANSTFGTASEAIMLADVSPVLDVTLAEGSVLSGNTFYGDVTVNGTATLKGNVINGVVTLGEGAKVLFTSDNTIDGNAVSYQENWKDYTFVGWDVVLNAEGKITSGTFVVGADGKDALRDLLAEDAAPLFYDPATKLMQNADKQYILDSAEALKNLTAYVNDSEETLTINAILTADINLDAELGELEEFGFAVTEGKTIKGTIDGQGHIIYGLKPTLEPYRQFNYTEYFMSLVFFNLDAEATVKNLNFITDFANMGTGSLPSTEVNGKLENIMWAQKDMENTTTRYIKYVYYNETTKKNNLLRPSYYNGFDKNSSDTKDLMAQLVKIGCIKTADVKELEEYINSVFGAYCVLG